MKRSQIIAVGVAFIVTLLVVFQQYKSKSSRKDQPSTAAIQINSISASEASGAKDILTEIQGLKIPPAAAKQMVAAYFEWKVAPQSSIYPYWQSPAVRDARNRITRYQIDEAKRQALIAAFGQSVSDDPDFASIFQPYRDKYPFLSTAKQLEIERLSLEVDRSLLNSGSTPIQAQSILTKARQVFTAALETLLTKEEFAQYQLRESPAAKMLANSGFNFNQNEFDAIYPTIPNDDGPIGLRRLDAETMERARGVLGEERFIEYRKDQDPMFHLLSTIVVAHGPANADINAAYNAVYQNQQEERELGHAGPAPSFNGYEKKEQLKADLKTKLTTLIGNDATDIFLRSMEANSGLMKTKLF